MLSSCVRRRFGTGWTRTLNKNFRCSSSAPIPGLMQNWQLTTTSIIEAAANIYSTKTITSRTVEGPMHQYTYGDSFERQAQLAHALVELGVTPGDRVATLAWNGYRHFEIWYAVSGLGAVVHTINPRLFPDQLAYIIGHAEDEILFADLTFVPLLEKLHPKLPTVKKFVIMTSREHMPTTSLPNAVCYEDLLSGKPKAMQWPVLSEDDACSLCYTSGTTGHPKGVLYSHRSTVLHAMVCGSNQVMGYNSQETVLAVVPMFHACAWSIPYTGPMAGSDLVMPGSGYDGPSIYELLDKYEVTKAAGVPTVWLALLQHIQKNNLPKPKALTEVLIGGSALPAAMFNQFRALGVTAIHAWGMTELSPLGAVGRLHPHHSSLPQDEQDKLMLKQGYPPYGVEMKISDGQSDLPHDGTAYGDLQVRGPWVCKQYFKQDGLAVDENGWFNTGDVATIDSEGYMQIVDRSKDVIKSGGEWISSVDIENAMMAHPAVLEAACIGVHHPKWDERPLLVLTLKEGGRTDVDDVKQFLSDKIAKWWMPDDVVIVEEIPHTATGKIQKLTLREQFKGYKLPTY